MNRLDQAIFQGDKGTLGMGRTESDDDVESLSLCPSILVDFIMDDLGVGINSFARKPNIFQAQASQLSDGKSKIVCSRTIWLLIAMADASRIWMWCQVGTAYLITRNTLMSLYCYVWGNGCQLTQNGVDS